MTLFALTLGAYSFIDIVIFIVIIAAVLGVLWVALRQFGVTIPPFALTIFWICVCAFVAILAIRFIASL